MWLKWKLPLQVLRLSVLEYYNEKNHFELKSTKFVQFDSQLKTNVIFLKRISNQIRLNWEIEDITRALDDAFTSSSHPKNKNCTLEPGEPVAFLFSIEHSNVRLACLVKAAVNFGYRHVESFSDLWNFVVEQPKEKASVINSVSQCFYNSVVNKALHQV